MSIEELLNPRYKVIAPYPNSKYRMGEIINYTDQSGSVTSDTFCQFYDKYPHLFKKLEWWEERDEKDMPEYLFNKVSGKIEKVSYELYSKNNFKCLSDGHYIAIHLHYLPSSKEEYEQYLQSQK